ncbi:MAG TPA: nucleotidyl transferase AbiEii/AbiGii toxin family protein [Tepidisphaeraceae bacterium]|nr:nucleotidyl transferase AbiEii/AbiGii toxin family protein [Tepidisphaeraceae bacterium]
MIPRAYITEWRAAAPWLDDAQVEQDLVLSRAVVELFNAPALGGKLALRGGTALNKLFLPEPVRYSEDIDLVQIEPAPIGPILDAVRATLDPWLGEPRRTVKQMATLAYRFESEVPPIRTLRLKVEINTHEHFTELGYQNRQLSVRSRWFTGVADILTYSIDELMGTKLRALYQRRKGRDLFDLWLCLDRGLVDSAAVIRCFHRYMAAEKHAVSRAQFEENLHGKARDEVFSSDIAPLLTASVEYDPAVAMQRVGAALIERLAGEPWRGTSE